MHRKTRVLIGKPGLDGHDRGAKVVAYMLRDAGMEVIYTGLRQTPEQIVKAAIQEDVDVIGLSILSGAHNILMERIVALLKKNNFLDVLLLVGGIIPKADAEYLKSIGVHGVFGPASSANKIVEFIRNGLENRQMTNDMEFSTTTKVKNRS